MRFSCSVLLSLYLLTLQHSVLAAPQVNRKQSQDFTYLVVAKDFTRHRVTLRYTGETWGNVYQTGRAAHGLNIQDTRKCHWDFWNHYGIAHVQTTNAATGAAETIFEPLKLQVGRDYPLHAPLISEIAALGVDWGAWIGIDRLKTIFNPADYKNVPSGAMALVTDLPQATAGIAVRMLARATGLRKGVNCGEAQAAINASSQGYQAALQANMGVVPAVEYFLNASNLYRHWAYRDPVSNSFIGALIVYPGNNWPDHLAASLKIWREIRQNMLGKSGNSVAAPVPTDAEVREFRDLISGKPDTWIETLIERYSTAIDQKMLDNMKAVIAAGLAQTWDLPTMPKPADYVVVYREYPARLSAEYFGLDAKTAAKVDKCGHGGIYRVEFTDGKMSLLAKMNAEGTLARSVGNAVVVVRMQMARLDWIAERLPAQHPLREDMTAFAAGLAPQVATFSDLDNVYNLRNVAYRNCLDTP